MIITLREHLIVTSLSIFTTYTGLFQYYVVDERQFPSSTCMVVSFPASDSITLSCPVNDSNTSSSFSSHKADTCVCVCVNGSFREGLMLDHIIHTTALV